MGYGLPAAIGAAIAGEGARRVICLVGDGSVMMNLQELQTLAHHQLPVIVIVVNNGGYASIQQSQRNFFGRLVGCDPAHGVSFPDFVRIAEACGMPATRVSGPDFTKDLDSIMRGPGPVLVDALVDGAQGFEPRITSARLPDGRFVSAEPDDMFPFLSPEERASCRFPGEAAAGRHGAGPADSLTGPVP
jgi:acetolactate synthase I/II/III large subunit